MKTSKLWTNEIGEKINNVLSLKFRRYIKRIREDNGYVIDQSLNCVVRIFGIVLCKDGNFYPVMKDNKISFNKLSRKNTVMYILSLKCEPSEVLATYEL